MAQSNIHTLPDNWVRTTLGQIRVDRSSSITPGKTPDRVFELYSVPSFSAGRPEIIAGQEIGSSKRIVAEKAVLLCKINPRINRVWVVGDFSPHTKIASTEWIPFSEVRGIEPDYLCYFMQQSAFRDHLALHASGVGGLLMRIKPATFEEYSFPLAPLPEQHRIVAEIETQFTRLDAGVAALKRAQANLRRYKASVLKAACEGRLVPTKAELARQEGREYEPADVLLERILTERRAKWEAEQWDKEIERAKKKAAQAKRKDAGLPARIRDLKDEEWQDLPEQDYGNYLPKDEKWKQKHSEPEPPDTSGLPQLPGGWVWTSIEQLARVVRGASPRPAGDPKYFGGSIPWITVGYLTADEQPYLLSVVTYVTEQGREKSRYIEPETLLLTNSGATLGVPKITRIGGCINDGIVALLDVDYPLKLYLYYLLTKMTEQLRTINQGAAQPNLNTSIVKSIAIPLPPSREQHRIVTEVERRLSVVQELEKQVEAALRRAERLRQAILKHAFEGKLVPQDPNDEPASALLERIQAHRP